jgi:L-threonate 2-dehydrogenase
MPQDRNRQQVGQIGLGIMGGAYARHLLHSGFDVSGYDPDPVRAAEFADVGGRPAASPAEVAATCRVIITSLPSNPAVEAALFGAEGVLQRAGAGATLIETSTLALETKLALRDRCAGAGVTVLDCPVSGTGAQAAAKDISVYASGEPGAVERCAGIFAGFARRTHYCGDYGNGSRFKFIANLLVTIHNLAAAEAVTLGRASGLDLDLLYDVIRDGAGNSRMFEVRAPLMIAGDYSRATMKVDVYQKDIDIIGAYASGLHCPTPLFDASRAYYSGAHAQGHAKHDTAAICAVLERMAGLERSISDQPPRKKQAP